MRFTASLARRARVPIGIVPVAVGALAVAASAQEAGTDSIPVVASEAIVVTILRDSVLLVETPRAVTILDAERTRRARPGAGLAETMRGIPGVRVEDRASEALDERIVVRGFGARAGFGVRGVRVVVDGIPATMPDGQTTLTHVDPRTVDRIEAARGPAGAAWGNASGGAISLETRDPPAGRLARATALRGGFGTWRLEASAGDGRGDAGWRVDASRVEADGHRAFGGSEITRTGARWRREGWEVVTSLARWDARNPGGLPDSLRGVDPSAAFPFNVVQRTGEEGTHGQVGTTWRRAGELADLEVGGWVLGREIDNPIPPAVVDLGRVAAGSRGIARGSLGTGVRWAVGAEVGFQRDRRRNFANEAGERGARTLDQIERVGDLGLWGRVRVDRGSRIAATAALRYDRTRFEADDRLTGPGETDDSGERSMDAWNPTAGILVRLAPGAQAWASVATAFETPTTSELANRPDGSGGFDPDLDPQRAWTVEAGLRIRRSRVAGEAVAFRTAVDDALVQFQVADQPARDFFRNAGSALHRGVEVAGRIGLSGGVTARLAYAWIEAEFDRFRTPEGRFDGHEIPGVRPHRLDASLTWVSGPWLAELEFRSASRVAVDDANTSFSDGWTVIDARVDAGNLAWGPLRIDPFGGVTNLFDASWDTAVVPNAFGGRFFEPGPGRAFYAGITAGMAGP